MKKIMLLIIALVPLILLIAFQLGTFIVQQTTYVYAERLEFEDSHFDYKVGNDFNAEHNKYILKYPATVFPTQATDKRVEYSSSDENIATISNDGLIIFNGRYGDVIISASLKSNPAISSKCSITVYDDVPHSVTINSDVKEIEINQSFKLNTEVLPFQAKNKSINWSSSDDNVISVSADGTITGLKTGEATITATTIENNCTVSINIKVVKYAEGIYVSKNKILTALDNIDFPDYELRPLNTTKNDVIFSSSNESVATVDQNGHITFLKEGKVRITISYKYNLDISSYCDIDSTFGKLKSAYFTENEKNVDYVKQGTIEYSINTVPTDFDKSKLTLKSNSDIVSITNGNIVIKKGGSCKVLMYNKETLIDELNILIRRYADNINIYNGNNVATNYIITQTQVLQLNTKLLPTDANMSEVGYSVIEGMATVNTYGEIQFGAYGKVKINVFDINNNCLKQEIIVEYVPKNCKIVNVSDDVLSGDINYGDIVKFIYSLNNREYDTTIENYIECLSVIDNYYKAIGVGKNIVSINANGKILAYELFINRFADSVELIANGNTGDFITAKKEIELQTKVLPNECTNKIVKYSVSDDSIAHISNNKLVFKKAGKVIVTASVGKISDSLTITSTFGLPNNFALAKTEAVINGINEPHNTITIDSSFFKDFTPNDYVFDINDFVISSDNSNIEILPNGVIKSNAKGKAVLTIQCGEISKEITIYTMLDGSLYTSKKQVDIPHEVIDSLQGKVVNYSIDDASIATVDENGIVTFKKAGEVNVSCVIDGVTLNAIVESTFGLPKDFSTKLSSDVIVGIGQTSTIEICDFAPNDYVFNWGDFLIISNNTNIVTVDTNGVITAKNKGTTQIAVSCNGNIKYLNIEVKIPVESINFVNDRNEPIYYLSTTKNLQLKVLPYPLDANDFDITYESLNKNIATISSGGLVTFYKAGIVKIKANANGKVAYIDICYLDNKKLIEITSDVKTINVNYGTEYFAIYLDNGHYKPFKNVAENNVVKIDQNGLMTVKQGGTDTLTINIYDKMQDLNCIASRKAEEILIDNSGFEIIDNNILTSKNNIIISAKVLPNDATNKDIKYKILQGDATVDSVGNVTINNEGIIIVELSVDDIKKNVTIKSTCNKPLLFDVEKNNIIIQNIGLTYNIVINNILPSDYVFNATDFIFSSDNEKVANVDNNGTIKGIGRGFANIKVEANGITKTLSIEVKQMIENIDITYKGEIIGDSKTYCNKLQLGANTLPLNANNPNVTFSIVSGNATITEDGLLNIVSGKAVVLVQSVDGNATKKITIEKLTDVLGLSILYNGNSTTSIRHFADTVCLLELSVIAEDVIGDISLVDIATFKDIEGLSQVTKFDDKTLAVACDKSRNNGNYNTTIQITVGNKTLNVDIEFYYATDLRLELNNEDDLNCGMERRRVFGNEFIDKNGNYIKTYQLQLAQNSTAKYLNKLFYKTSNAGLATVDGNGLITFVGSRGFVTITVCTENDFNENTSHFMSSYTFEVIPGVNIYTQKQFKQAVCAKNRAIVFQIDLLSQKQANEKDAEGKPIHKVGTYDVLSYEVSDENPNFLTLGDRAGKSDEFYYIMFEAPQDVYGNGHILNMNCYAEKEFSVKSSVAIGNVNKRMRIRIRSTFSNLTICGYDFDPTKESYKIPNESADQMGLRIWLQKRSGATGATLRYCIIQQFNTAVEVMYNPVYISNCVVRYCTHFGIYQGGDEQPDVPTFYKNLVIDDAGQFAILYQQGRLVLDGVIYINNFNTVNDYEQKYRTAMKEVINNAKGQGFVTADDRFNAAIVTMTNPNPILNMKMKDNIYYTKAGNVSPYDVNNPNSNPLNFKMLEANKLGFKVKAWTWSMDILPPDSAVLEQKIQEIYRPI